MQEGLTFWNIFWLLFIIIPLLLTWVFGLVDVFRREDLSGLAKVLWMLLILVVPIVGIVVYFAVRPVSREEQVFRDVGTRGARAYGEREYRRP